jgi:uncharacterized membrane protein YidH (DUF202 family)
MKFTSWFLLILTAAAFAAVIGIARYAGFQYAELPALFLQATAVVKMVETILILGLIATLVAGVVLMATGKKAGDTLILTLLGWLGVALGLLAFAFAALNIWIAVERTHTTNPQVVAPSVAEALLPVCLGLLMATIASFVGGVMKARAKRSSLDAA